MELAVISDVWFIFDQDKNEGLIPGRRPSPPELLTAPNILLLENFAPKIRNFMNFYQYKFSAQKEEYDVLEAIRLDEISKLESDIAGRWRTGALLDDFRI